jgi:hypothetical protein
MIDAKSKMQVDRVRKRLFESSTTHYLTLISIIQGAVLGYGISVLDTSSQNYGIANWLLCITTLLFVISVWDEYQLASTLFEWMPGIRDSIIPFLIGLCEFIMVRFLKSDQKHWYIAAGCFAFFCFLGFWNMYASARNNNEANGAVLSYIGKYSWVNYIYCLVSSGIFLSFALRIEAKINERGLAIWTLIVMVGFLARGRWLRHRMLKFVTANN